ncbi:MAG: glycosyltransferase family 2 protein [Dehalococcoidales bacterium]|jgi:glycosyltransferase involved in cell wall biosynthesis|nr:glycosyltransferase family 2 protein [Dehalococcoidales bacterium]
MPALDEAPCITDVISSVPVDEFAAKGFDVEILVVDNGSVDGTADLAGQAGARVIHEPRRGYGRAYLKGFVEAKGDIICTMDADGTYPSSVLPDMVVQLISEDLDFINTDRFSLMTNGVMPRTNRVGNYILNFVSRTLFRMPFRDSQSGMWVFRAKLLEKMDLRAINMALSEEIKIEAACRLRARCAELPIHYGYRSGCPKLHPWRDGIRNLLHLVRKRFI